MNTYIVTLKHDYGKIKIQVVALTFNRAINIIMKTEGCPENAIQSIKKIKEE